MYELIILSLLMRFPLHGYLIAKIANDMIGPWSKISSGTLYPLLARLERTGLIAVSDDVNEQSQKDRQYRTFKITEAGRKRFHQLMMDTTSNSGEYQKFFRYKVIHIEFLQPNERLHLLNHYIHYCETAVLHLTAEAHDLVQENAEHHFMTPSLLESVLKVMQHVADQWREEENWAKQLREQEVARIEAGDQQPTEIQERE